jgi:hypothetical protein
MSRQKNPSSASVRLPVTFNWAKATFSPVVHSAGFFTYAAIILFFCFGLIPNFLPVPEWVFRICMVALVFLLDRLFTRWFAGYTLQGKIEVGEKELRLVSVAGRTEHILKYSDIYQVYVLEGIPMSLFTALSEHRTVVVEVVFRDKRTMRFESVKWAKDPHAKLSFEKAIDEVRHQFGK